MQASWMRTLRPGTRTRSSVDASRNYYDPRIEIITPGAGCGSTNEKYALISHCVAWLQAAFDVELRGFPPLVSQSSDLATAFDGFPTDVAFIGYDEASFVLRASFSIPYLFDVQWSGDHLHAHRSIGVCSIFCCAFGPGACL